MYHYESTVGSLTLRSPGSPRSSGDKIYYRSTKTTYDWYSWGLDLYVSGTRSTWCDRSKDYVCEHIQYSLVKGRGIICTRQKRRILKEKEEVGVKQKLIV